MKLRLLPAVGLVAAILAQLVLAADAETGTIAQGLLAGFEHWLAPQLSTGFALEEPVPGKESVVPIAASGVAPTAEAAKPSLALRDEQAKLNYHGVHFAVAMLEADGKHLALRPFSKGFNSGERFKLRVVATFNGYVQVENINPKWQRKQIFPAAPNQRILLSAGKEKLIPEGQNEYFEFTQTQGEEQLVVTVQDERVTDKNTSHSRVYRQDRDYGSNFIQQSEFDTFPAIAGYVKLRHN
jgi:hypothetical protein